MKKISVLMCTWLGSGLLAAMPVQAIEYNFIDLGSSGESGSSASAVNDAGQVAGTSFYSDATLWSSRVRTQLPGYRVAGRSYAIGINNPGQIVGTAEIDSEGEVISHATLWNRGQPPVDLGSLGGSYSAAVDINDSGQIAGTSLTPGDTGRHAVLWSGGVMTDLGSGTGRASWGNAINGAGQVAVAIVWGEGLDYRESAAVWNGAGAPTLLAGAAGGSSVANDINDQGQVAGTAFGTGATSTHAVVWNAGVLTDLGVLDPSLPGNFSEAYAINELGQVVGRSFSDSEQHYRATLWESGSVIDLTSFLDPTLVQAGWRLTEAFDINENGEIVGTALNLDNGQEHAFLLSPVPEPAGVALLLAGLGLVGGVAHRKRRAGAEA